MQKTTESFEEILASALRCGWRLRRPQLRRYQQNGLIPEPRQVGLGRGSGTRVVYPTGTGRRLVAACEALAQNRSFRIARWRLWWDGYAINSAHIRTVLRKAITESRKKITLPREVRRRLRVGQAKHLADVVSKMQAGNFDHFPDPTDERLFGKAMGLPQVMVAEMRRPDYWPEPGLGNLLARVSQTINAKEVRLALDAATDSDLAEARNEIRAALGRVDIMAELLERLRQPGLARFVRKLSSPSVTEQQSFLLGWLSARRFPEARRVYETLLRCSSDTLSLPEKEDVGSS